MTGCGPWPRHSSESWNPVPGPPSGLLSPCQGRGGRRRARLGPMTRLLPGTASWTDKPLIEGGRFYPPEAKSAEARLRHYATRFPLVEVDAPYYGLPTPRQAERWVERTPPGFTFDVKAYSLFTEHPTPVARLPKANPGRTAARPARQAPVLPPRRPARPRRPVLGALHRRAAAAARRREARRDRAPVPALGDAQPPHPRLPRGGRASGSATTEARSSSATAAGSTTSTANRRSRCSRNSG